jgi:UDP-GlcNAc:undecaprenyl-phosphate GlcNAc-1-phosphate transferase
VLAGVCIGFLPHNFNPARIFMGDTGAMLLGLLLAYGPISSTATLDQNILITYALNKPVDRFATILPLLLPIAILIIPYTDLLLAVFRRMAAGQSPFAADRQHLHHRLQNMGHSHRQTVLLMYLWAALFSGTVVGLSVIRVPLVWLALATLGAVIALVLATMPKLRPWRSTGKRAAGTRSRHRIGATPARSTGPITAANGQAAAARGPALNGAAPVLSAPLGAPPAPAGPTAPAGPAAPLGPPNVTPNGAPSITPNGTPNGHRAAAPPTSRHARNAGATRP